MAQITNNPTRAINNQAQSFYRNDNYNNYNNYYLPMDYNSYQYGQIDQTPLIQPNISNGYQSSLMANDPPNNNSNGRFIYY